MRSSFGKSALAWIGVGANLDNPVAQLESGIEQLDGTPAINVACCSSFYRSDPMGPQDQPRYVNAVIRIETQLSPTNLLDRLQAVEDASGRLRKERWGARTLDLDILLYDQLDLVSERLTIPHPGITLRSFVLIPLLEIDPEIVIPGLGPASEFRSSVADYGLTILEPPNAT